MKKVLFVVGSLRKDSFNRQLAQEAAAHLAGKAQTAFLDIASVPLVNQDCENPVLPAVAELRRRRQRGLFCACQTDGASHVCAR